MRASAKTLIAPEHPTVCISWQQGHITKAAYWGWVPTGWCFDSFLLFFLFFSLLLLFALGRLRFSRRGITEWWWRSWRAAFCTWVAALPQVACGRIWETGLYEGTV